MSQDDPNEFYLNNVWWTNLSITGIDEIPFIKDAGNVLRPKTAIRLSFRLCPALDAQEAEKTIIEKITTNVPYNAKVTVLRTSSGTGWVQKDLEPWVQHALSGAGKRYFDGRDFSTFGVGGSVPILNILAEKYPAT